MKDRKPLTQNKLIIASLIFTMTIGSFSTALAQDRLIVKGTFVAQGDRTSRVQAVLIASNGEQMAMDITRNGKFNVNAPAEDTYTLRFSQPGCVTKEIIVDGHNANNKKYGERTVKFDMVLHPDHPETTMRYNGPVAQVSFAEGSGDMHVIQKYQMVPLSSFTAEAITSGPHQR